MRCDFCGTDHAPIVVDSFIGLALWNKFNPRDQRTELHLCNDVCNLALGIQLGRLMREMEGLR